MPIIKSAKKKMRQDKKRTKINRKIKEAYKSLLKKAKKEMGPENMKAVQSALDKAAKKNIIGKNKAARLKSALSRLYKKRQTKAPEKKESDKKQNNNIPILL